MDNTFDQNLASLESLVSRIKSGDIKIAELKQKVDEGLKYVEACRRELEGIRASIDEAEQGSAAEE